MPRTVQPSGGGHGARSAAAFLAGLKEQTHVVCQIGAQGREGGGEAQTDGHVSVVSAGMAEAVVERGESFLRRKVLGRRAFLHAHGVDVEAQHGAGGQVGAQIDHEAGRAVHALKPRARRAFGFGPLQRFAHDFRRRHAHAGLGSGDGRARHGRKPEACQLFGQAGGGPEFGHAGFGVLMEQSAQGRESFLREGGMMFCHGGCACGKKGKERVPSPVVDGRAREQSPAPK